MAQIGTREPSTEAVFPEYATCAHSPAPSVFESECTAAVHRDLRFILVEVFRRVAFDQRDIPISRQDIIHHDGIRYK
jgi:hypothetical protein